MRWLCLDPGMKRTGVALSNPEGTFAVPLLVLTHGRSGPSIAEVAELVEEHRATGVVVGLPLSMDGTASEQTRFAVEVARSVAVQLGARLEVRGELGSIIGVPDETESPDSVASRVVLWDERLTTFEAKRMAGRETRPKGRRKQPQHLDAHAAAVILQSFLDSQPRVDKETGDETMPAAREKGLPDLD